VVPLPEYAQPEAFLGQTPGPFFTVDNASWWTGPHGAQAVAFAMVGDSTERAAESAEARPVPISALQCGVALRVSGVLALGLVADGVLAVA
jgi:hypothetical protein